MDITINSAEVQAYQVTKPEIQVLTFTAPANPITTDTGGKKVTLGGVEYTIAPGADGVAIETAADVAGFFANVLSDRFDDADISATAAPAGSVVMNFVLDDGDVDLTTNVHPRSFPKGHSVEIIKVKTLIDLANRGLSDDHCEHVS